MENHEFYMRRCFALAQLGLGRANPNPLVGSVVVHNNTIIGEGYHAEYGKAHAEVIAIENVQDKDLLKKSTLFVNLEPCSHFGKTPPCTDLIIRSEIPEVVISTIDPFEKVSGKGVERLRKAGVLVHTDVLKASGNFINRRFFTFHIKKRPYIILKWAQSKNGFLDLGLKKVEERISEPISGVLSRQLVHQWRAQEMGILVGDRTVAQDNPSLTVRLASGKNPLRIVLDPLLLSPDDSRIFDDSVKTYIFTTLNRENSNTSTVEYVKVSEAFFLDEVLVKLYDFGVQSILVEGGAFTLQQFIDKGIYDEARIFTSNALVEGKTKAPVLDTKPSDFMKVGSDNLAIHYNITV
ncbi:MAG: bifunctional diaminohydroxyphosphoribosylaminopyrimidine deaminase/5-amino-6-(5-phosphoribosylamino)uracil reductase RibD [Luteibaculaceae bacterium]